MTAPPAGALEACPFCGGEALGIVESRGVIPPSYSISCSDVRCLAMVEGRTAVRARLMWNRRTHGPALLAALRLREWRPIESAPKDGTPILVSCPGIGVVIGKWRRDEYAKNPRPYWTNDAEYIRGKIATREDQPTHWMSLPAPPTDDDLARVLEEGE